MKTFVIISIPVLMPEMELSLVEACDWMREKKPSVKLIFSALFSSLAQFANLKDACPNILHFINILCIANKERFIKNIRDHYLDEETNPFFDPLLLHEKLHRRIKKSLDKVLAKHNKNKTKSLSSWFTEGEEKNKHTNASWFIHVMYSLFFAYWKLATLEWPYY